MPQLGESIAEATVVNVTVEVGEEVEADQDIIEVETNKAVMSVTTPGKGRVHEITAEMDESYPVGAVLGYLEVDDAEATRLGVEPEPITKGGKSKPKKSAAKPVREPVKPTVRGLPVPAHAAGAAYLSPRMKARMEEFGLHAADLAGVAGSGSGGRVTIEDLEKFLADLEKKKITPASTMRVAVADAMRRSWTRPLATVALSIGLDPLLAFRKTCDPKPGPALFAIRALALALSKNSALAGRLVGDRIIHPQAIDIGFAVEVEDGVLVPVLRAAHQASLEELLPRYNELVEKARQRRLPQDATGGSIATVTNFGSFGLTWATPIPLPEQTMVLGMGAGRVAPRWNAGEKRFDPVTEAEITLSFDHRVLDGGGAGRLLADVRDLMENPADL